MGDHESHQMAMVFVSKAQKALEKERLAKKYHNIETLSSRDFPTSAPPSFRGWRSSGKRTKLGSWSGLKRWNDGSLERPATISWSHNLVLENKHASKKPLQLRRSNLYRTKGILERLNSQDSSDLNGILKTTRPSFYTLGEFMEPVHHRLTSDDEEGSVTEYEDIEDTPYVRDRNHPVFGSARHLKNLRKVKHICYY